MTEQNMQLSPSEQLAQRILQKMLQENLLSLEEATKIRSKVSGGIMEGTDWKLTFEKSLGLHKQKT